VESAFGVDHGEIEKAFKLPKPGKIFGRPGSLNRTGQTKKPGSTGFKAGQAAGGAARTGFSGVGMGAGKTAGAMGFQRAGQAMQRNPVKTGVTTSFLAGTAAAVGLGRQKKPGQQ